MIDPTQTVGICIGAGAIGWCFGAVSYTFRRVFWTAAT